MDYQQKLKEIVEFLKKTNDELKESPKSNNLIEVVSSAAKLDIINKICKILEQQ